MILYNCLQKTVSLNIIYLFNSVFNFVYFILFSLGNRSHSIDEGLKKIEKCVENKYEVRKKNIARNGKPDRVRGLFNPFDKSQFHIKSTSNRRRWSHTFPESNNIIIIE